MSDSSEQLPEAGETATGNATAPDGTTSHDIGLPAGLAAAIAEDWDSAAVMPHPAAPTGGRSAGADSAAANRGRVSAAFAGKVLVIPAGQLSVRANDTDYSFRAFSAFTWLSGETAEGAVLVLFPDGGAHRSVLYIREYDGPGRPGYFTNRRFGALWVGNVPSIADTANALDLPVVSVTELARDLQRWSVADVLLARGVDDNVDRSLPGAGSGALLEVIDELRLTKDAWEISELQAACEATTRGFADVVAELPGLLAGRGTRAERWLEGTFWRRARLEGNDVGYTSIIGAGSDATTLHWWRNHGDISDGQLLLADMGVEVDSLYTADVTRTLPVNGQWSATQRQLYLAVLEAQQAGIAEVKTGADFLAAHRAAMWVLADHLYSWGVLSVPADVACGTDPDAPGAGLHRRYTLHGVSHMLGIDVHDCAAARDSTYREGPLGDGYVLTVEPGLYFQPNDLSVKPEWRGIGIRIEDDILVTGSGPVNLSASLPRDPDELTAWMRDVQHTPADRR